MYQIRSQARNFYMTLYDSLFMCLQSNGKTLSDIRWVGCKEFTIPIENFLRLAEQTNDYLYANIAVDLLVVGENFWLERADEELREPWVFRSLPPKPTLVYSLKALALNDLSEQEQNQAANDNRNTGAGYLPYAELWMMLYKQ